MILRVAVAVTFTAAILAIALPALETGGVQHSDERVAAELERVGTVAGTLAGRNDPPPPGEDGARVTVRLQLPVDGWGQAGVDWFRIDPGENTVSWRVSGGAEQVRHVDTVRLAGEPLRFETGGAHRLRLSLQPDGSVRIARPDV